MSGWHGRRLEANQSALEHALEDLNGDHHASYEPIAPSLWATQGDLRPRLRRATKWHACSLLFCFVAFSFREQIATFSALVSRLAGMDWAKGKRQTANARSMRAHMLAVLSLLFAAALPFAACQPGRNAAARIKTAAQAAEERCIEMSVELNPANPEAHVKLGTELKNLRRDYDGAEAAFRKAIELDPNHVNARINLGVLLRDMRNDYDGAEGAFREAINIEPKEGTAHWNLSILLEKRGDLSGAIEAARGYIRAGDRDKDGQQRIERLTKMKQKDQPIQAATVDGFGRVNA